MQLLVIPEVEAAVKRLPLVKHKAAKLNCRMWTQLAFSTTAVCRNDPLKLITIKEEFLAKCKEILVNLLNLTEDIAKDLLDPRILTMFITDTYLFASHPSFDAMSSLFGYLVDQYYGVGEGDQ